jgi:hypothetical protein
VSDTWQDAEHEQGMEELYKEFKQQYEDDFVFERVLNFYKTNSDIADSMLSNFKEAESLFENDHYAAAFLHAIISIETGIKVIILKPILSSLSIDQRATELLFKDTFKRKSIPDISLLYFQILYDLTNVDLNKIKRNGSPKSLLEEFRDFQKIRNNIMHQGKFTTKEVADNALSLANFVIDEIIPIVLNRFHSHLDNNKIVYG